MKKNKQLKRAFLLVLGFLFVLSTSAQEKTISGNVTSSEDGMSLPGVNIVVKGTKNGVSTDFDGNYTIKVNGNNEVLVFSYLGFKTKQITATQSIINTILEIDAGALDEVVVVGYGSRKKSDITGSVSSVKSEELNAFPVLDATQAIQGRAAGVAVQSNNGGEPGAPISVKIRGNTSIGAGSAALIVVDGFVGASMPQANDIESLEILKDASATAIYGSRGANGVILVTTKKGKSGKLSVELNSTYSVQSTSERLDLLNTDQFTAYQQALNPAFVKRSDADTDWQDLILKSGSIANHQLSFSGGTDKINFYVSGTYFDQKGIVVNSGFQRTSFLSNVDAQVTDKLKLGFNAFGSRSDKDGISSQANTGGRGTGDVVSIAFRFSPDLPLFDANGVNSQDFLRDGIDNPVAVAKESVDETKSDDFRANFYANYDIIENLTFKTTFGLSSENVTRGTYRPSTLVLTAGNQGGIAAIASLKRTSVLSENYLTFNKEIGKGNLTLLAGYSYQKNTDERFSAGAQGFTSDSFSYYNLSGGSVQLTPSSSLIETEILSQFGRLNYDYDDKYLLTATIRRDGASNFAANEKYAYFPSGALGWKVSNEDFLKDNATISNLKLRASYGVTGNPSIAPYQSLASFENIYTAVGGQTVNSVVPNQQSNPDLKWESSYQTNFGIDLGLLNNKISLSLDYYNIDTKDLILGDTGQPEYFGFLNNQSLKNIGEINNKGFEISLNTRNITTDNFTWKTDLNWSRNRNKVVKLINGDDVFFNASPGHFTRDQTHILREGEAVGVFWAYEYQGVYQGGVLPEGTAALATNPLPGDELFSDLDGNGRITAAADRKIVGDPNQDWIMGITNNFTYKDFDLNIFFQGAFGGDIMSLTLIELANGNSNSTTEVLNAWTPTNTDTNIPRAAIRANDITSRFVYDGSYIRLKNISLGYNLPTDIAKKLGLEKVRFAISGQNLLTFTDYPGLDPEVSYRASGNQNSNVNQGFDYGNYPTVKSVNFSLNLKF